MGKLIFFEGDMVLNGWKLKVTFENDKGELATLEYVFGNFLSMMDFLKEKMDG